MATKQQVASELGQVARLKGKPITPKNRKAIGDERKSTAARMAKSNLNYDPLKVMKVQPEKAVEEQDEHPKVTAAKRKAERKAKAPREPKPKREKKVKAPKREYTDTDIQAVVAFVVKTFNIPEGKVAFWTKFVTSYAALPNGKQDARLRRNQIKVALMSELVNKAK